MNCRNCHHPLEQVFLDLGFAPPSNAYRLKEELNKPELTYPLRILVCNGCWLVQTEDFVEAGELFNPTYAYFSSTSTSWLEHAEKYFDMIQKKLALNAESLVLEVASNDGYLLKNFVEAGIPCLGIEPTDSTAHASEQLGVPVLREFFGMEMGNRLAAEGKQADLIIGNNVYAHVPDINDFTSGLKAALKQGGTITLEFAYIFYLIKKTLFDIVYHEHYSYLSLYNVQQIFDKADLKVLDVEELPTQGGSLRVYGTHSDDPRPVSAHVEEQLRKEESSGLREMETYKRFQPRVDKVKDSLILFLIEQKRRGKCVAAYGAAAKGNTLLNYAGIKPDLIPFVCDAAPSKQGKFLPGSRIPICSPIELRRRKPNILVILPWNIAEEVVGQHDYVREWGGQFVTLVPDLRFL